MVALRMLYTRKFSVCGVSVWGGARNVWRLRVDPYVTEALCLTESPPLKQSFLGESHHLSEVLVCLWRNLGRMSEVLEESMCPCVSESLRSLRDSAWAGDVLVDSPWGSRGRLGRPQRVAVVCGMIDD